MKWEKRLDPEAPVQEVSPIGGAQGGGPCHSCCSIAWGTGLHCRGFPFGKGTGGGGDMGSPGCRGLLGNVGSRVRDHFPLHFWLLDGKRDVAAPAAPCFGDVSRCVIFLLCCPVVLLLGHPLSGTVNRRSARVSEADPSSHCRHPGRDHRATRRRGTCDVRARQPVHTLEQFGIQAPSLHCTPSNDIASVRWLRGTQQ